MCVFLISPVPIAEPLTSELIDTPVFYNLAPRPIKYRVSVPIPSQESASSAWVSLVQTSPSPPEPFRAPGHQRDLHWRREWARVTWGVLEEQGCVLSLRASLMLPTAAPQYTHKHFKMLRFSMPLCCFPWRRTLILSTITRKDEKKVSYYNNYCNNKRYLSCIINTLLY